MGPRLWSLLYQPAATLSGKHRRRQDSSEIARWLHLLKAELRFIPQFSFTVVSQGHTFNFVIRENMLEEVLHVITQMLMTNFRVYIRKGMTQCAWDVSLRELEVRHCKVKTLFYHPQDGLWDLGLFCFHTQLLSDTWRWIFSQLLTKRYTVADGGYLRGRS